MTKHKRAQLKLDRATDALWEAVQAVADMGRFGVSSVLHRLHEELAEIAEGWTQLTESVEAEAEIKRRKVEGAAPRDSW